MFSDNKRKMMTEKQKDEEEKDTEVEEGRRRKSK
jgi:hypothetical protein